MTKLLLRLSAVILSLGMLGAAACSGCSGDSSNSNKPAVMQQQSMHCGAYTHRVGNQCVGDSSGSGGSNGTSSRQTQPATLKSGSN